MRPGEDEETPDPTVPAPPEIMHGGTEDVGATRLCNFCQYGYDIKRTVCPRCGKPFPKMPGT